MRSDARSRSKEMPSELNSAPTKDGDASEPMGFSGIVSGGGSEARSTDRVMESSRSS